VVNRSGEHRSDVSTTPDPTVPQALAHDLDVDACLEEQRGVGVAKAMQRDRGQCG
jgi:hypothetical protein